MTFSAFFPRNLHNNASMLNLGPLEMRLKKIKPTIDISTNPEVMAAILYGMGVNPATKINKYPYSLIDFENKLNSSFKLNFSIICIPISS